MNDIDMICPQMLEPPRKAIADFIAKCSDDPLTRTMAISSFVLNFWQLAGRHTSTRLPSMIMVRAGEQKNDPLLNLVRQLGNTTYESTKVGEGTFAGGTPQQATKTMLEALNDYKEHLANNALIYRPVEEWEERYHDARVVGYGEGDISPYTKAWHPELGLITDKLDSILLHLDNETDWSTFRHDLTHDLKKIQTPGGIGLGFHPANKLIGLSGHLHIDDLDPKLVDGLLESSQPIFFLPHATPKSINIPNLPALYHFLLRPNRPMYMQIITHHMTPDQSSGQQLINYLWQRLSLLPAPYRFPVMTAIHQLDCVCWMLAQHAGSASKDSDKKINALYKNLYYDTLLALTLSVSFLAWQGQGLNLGSELGHTRKLLTRLREDGSMSLRDAQRVGGFGKAKVRDEVIEKLQAEGLVKVEERTISAVPMEPYIEGLHNRLLAI